MLQTVYTKLNLDKGGEYGSGNLPARCEDVLITWINDLDIRSKPVKITTRDDLAQVQRCGKIVVAGTPMQLTIFIAPFCGGHSDIAAKCKRLQDGKEVKLRDNNIVGGGSYELKDGVFEIFDESTRYGRIPADMQELAITALNKVVEG